MKKGSYALILAVAFLILAVSAAYAITNGRPDGNRHPYVGLIVFDSESGPAWRCSGSLLSPTLVLTAGHCASGAVAARVWFDENVEGNAEYPFGGTTSYEGAPHAHPDLCIGCGRGLPGFATGDLGVVVLSEPVPASVVSRYAELPSAGLADRLKNNTSIELVGYGVQEQVRGDGRPMWTGLKLRLYAPSRMISGKFKHSDEFIRISLNQGRGKGGFCFGDSGGPDLLGGTDTVLAVNSYLTNSNCAGVGYSSRVDSPEMLEWIDSFMD